MDLMASPFPNYDWDKLTALAQDGLKGSGAMVEATRRFVESSDKYARTLIRLTYV